MRFLAVDPGGKRMGLAVGDDLTGIASPLRVVLYPGAEAAAVALAAIADEVGAGVVVIGLPLAVDGSRTPACARSEALARSLTGHGLEVVLQGEHLTSNEAHRRARDIGLPRGRPVDHLAAQVVLEEFLAARAADGSGGSG